MPAPRIDLHTHSTASDGTTAPADLVRLAAAAGLDVVALTDHDTTSGHTEAAEALPAGLTLVPGAELSCASDGISLHLLAYLFDPEEPELAEVMRQMRESRVGRAERMVRRLEDAGTGVTWERVQALAQGTVGRPHVAQALVEAGCIPSVGAAFTPEWIGTHGRFWEPKLELDVVRGVQLVVAAGGVAVFAHPAAVRRGRTVGDDVVVAMAEAGLAGLEVDHVDHDEDAKEHLRGLAAQLGLLVTGSSDFHGSNKTVQLGASTTAPEVFEAVVERASGADVLTA
ncbi:MAG TPA: PHP domain-containing protein [Mycobacteriales bacterium]|nr:PHP domain-containing protein [Mycobacteriales bacterium]